MEITVVRCIDGIHFQKNSARMMGENFANIVHMLQARISGSIFMLCFPVVSSVAC